MLMNWLVLSAMVFVLYELFWFVVGGCEAEPFFKDNWMFLGIDALVCFFLYPGVAGVCASDDFLVEA